MSFQLKRDSALDLTLQGTVGSFRVGGASGETKSLEVKYFLTHVGLNFSSSSNDKLLSALAPVREIFDLQSLDFDEIMQRDIDDARVSSELVPYLLDKQSKGMIKLFPPIVIVVMPIREGRNQPDAFYPEVISETLPPTQSRDYRLHITRSGSIGNEVFEFQQPFFGDDPVISDLVRLKINTQKTRLVIVDGQHRAMALLAIYRNLKDQWSDERRAPFKEYYSAWTKNYIEQFKLDEINLPVLLCTVPELDAKFSGDFDMKKAARAIFLTLNKTARQVSDSRNKLLDDNDLISVLMRRTLSHIKDKDAHSPYALRISNVELDQEGSRQKIQTAIAITGVPHIYYIIEHMMLDNGNDVRGSKPRSGRFSDRTRLGDMLERLEGRDLLGAATADALRRDFFTSDAVSKLGKKFDENYGNFIIATLEQFAPFNTHNQSVLELSQQLEREHDRQLRPILLEGQGIGRVFDAHRKNLSQLLGNGFFQTDVPEIQASLSRLNATAERIVEAVKRLHKDRAERFFSDMTDKKVVRGEDGHIHPKMIDWCNQLYDNVLETVAFQAALVCGFQGILEKLQRKSKAHEVSKNVAFQEYITQLNQFFCPRTPAQLKRLIRVLNGEVADGELWTIRPSNQTFRSVVFRAEMQPDQWPKYRYLLLEIWRPTDAVLQEIVFQERDECRREIFVALHATFENTFCQEHKKLREELSKDERKQVFNHAYDTYSSMLKNLGSDSLVKTSMQQALSDIPETEQDTTDESIGVE